MKFLSSQKLDLVKFALFFLGEYLGLFVMCALGVTLFLGGWSAPIDLLNVIPSWIWFFGKLLALICSFIWVRGTMPRIRMDQLMKFAWKFMLPMALFNILAAAAWWFAPFSLKWISSTAIVVIAYSALGRALIARAGFGKRTYKFAT